MAYTTISAVQSLLGQYNYDSVTDLQQFIDTADVIVQRVKSNAATLKKVYLSTNELEMIERWLAAHLYTMYDPLYQSKSTGGASGAFMGQSGLNLQGSRYGQTASRLDYSGMLNAIGMRAVAGATWLGRPKNITSLPGGVVVSPQISIAISSPANNSAYSIGNQVTISSNVAGGNPPYSVQFTVNSANLNDKVDSAPYQTIWNTSSYNAGVYKLAAYVVDDNGNQSIAAPITISLV